MEKDEGDDRVVGPQTIVLRPRPAGAVASVATTFSAATALPLSAVDATSIGSRDATVEEANNDDVVVVVVVVVVGVESLRGCALRTLDRLVSSKEDDDDSDDSDDDDDDDSDDSDSDAERWRLRRRRRGSEKAPPEGAFNGSDSVCGHSDGEEGRAMAAGRPNASAVRAISRTYAVMTSI